ncbi:hexose kinase [Nesterenkonia sp. HG001]|uniref:1-phosphofructokinase family hexose kinase n=1 Tax=Nesterenkonia sp. HG001 TaxID=2983207 RepID=UPI002AC38F82|nr:hexose kinase [Nesterenkonia sp. HG001]MDZ5076664.1 hexose kinase [Nesterenkonia sp. HG001]
MIITLTPNPSLDKTVELDAPLAPGAVQRAVRASAEPGGKGVNISRALVAAGQETLAVLPGDAADPVLAALREIHVPHRGLALGEAVRTNITVTDPAGTTTKINEPGPAFDTVRTQALLSLTLSSADGASWAALAGSLPPGVPTDFYAQVITGLRTACDGRTPKIALDSSGPALAAAVAAEPELIKPNGEELLELVTLLTGQAPLFPDGTSIRAEELERRPDDVLRLVRTTQDHGVRAALVTLGAHGALFVPAEPEAQVLRAWGPELVARSTVGAGDASLAGFLLADQLGRSTADRLRQAAAQGRAAAALPGSVMPSPEDLDLDVVVVEPHPA